MKLFLLSISMVVMICSPFDVEAKKSIYGRTDRVKVQGEASNGTIVSGIGTNRQVAQSRAEAACRQITNEPCKAYF